jgi:hypothetical protein
MQEAETVEGVFWQIETPDRRAPGCLEFVGTDLPLLVVDRPIFDERSYSRHVSATGGLTSAHSGDPHDLVADFQPRTIHGELTDGVAVSAIDAQGGRRSFGLDFSQHFRCRCVVMGAQVDSNQLYAATRFRLEGPSWPLPDGQATTTDGSVLRILPVSELGDTQWFEFEPAQPATLNYFDVRVMNPVITLYALVTDNLVDHRDLQVQRHHGSEWIPVYEGIRDLERQGNDLLAKTYLTPQRFARWIDFRAASDGLDAAVLDELDGVAIQTQVLALAAVAEGLHHRLFPDAARAKRVPAVSREKCRQARKAAQDAAVGALVGDRFTDNDRDEFGQAVKDALSHLNSRALRSRMSDLIAVAEQAAPGITASFRDWPDAVVYARNILAHKGTQSLDEFEAFLELLIALKYSLRWVLRTVLLDHAGIDAPTIQAGYNDSSAYRHHLANVRHHLLASGRHAAAGLQPG